MSHCVQRNNNMIDGEYHWKQQRPEGSRMTYSSAELKTKQNNNKNNKNPINQVF